MVGIEGTTGSVTNTTHRAEVTEDNKLAVYATGSNGTPVNTDINGVTTYESGLIVMTHRHWRVNECRAYTAGSSFYEIPLNGSASLLFNVGSVDAHFHLEARSDGDFRGVLMENTNVSNSGTSLNIFNRRRGCDEDINSSLFANPTIGAAGSGDVIYSTMFLGGSGIESKFASADVKTGADGEAWMLAAGSSYLFKFDNVAGRSATVVWDIGLHLHNNGE